MSPKVPDVQAPAVTTIPAPVAAPVNITPFAAVQKVNVFVKMEISTQMRAEQPELIAGKRPCWLVPVVFTLPSCGVVGRIGEILVDATTGEVLVEEGTIQRMSDDADRLAQSASS